MTKHIDDLLRDWEYDPENVSVRICEGDDGRELIQLRIDMGILQLEVDGRPDGTNPEGFDTFYDFLIAEQLSKGPDWELDDEQCAEIDREFVQFYHRRVSWLNLERYELAVRDADHTLGLMDFCKVHSPDDQWTVSHEQYRPFVLYHRTRADALAALIDVSAEEAMRRIDDGLNRIRSLFKEHDVEEYYDDDELVAQLNEFREFLRNKYDVGRTLHEQLAEAIENEEYELAAKLRDQIGSEGAEDSPAGGQR